MDRLISCEFNMDTACVELKFFDGSMIAIDTIAVENEVADNMYQRSELDYLIYNDPVAYLSLIHIQFIQGLPNSGYQQIVRGQAGHADGVHYFADKMEQMVAVSYTHLQDKYYVRGTFTHYNLDFADDVLHLADLGFKQISVEPVVAEDSEEYALREEDLPKLFAEYDKLAAEMVERKKSGKDFNFVHFMIDLEGGPVSYTHLRRELNGDNRKKSICKSTS